MRFRSNHESEFKESPLRGQIFGLRDELSQELGGEELPAMEEKIANREELSFLFSWGYLFNVPRFTGMVVVTYDNDDNLRNPGYERGTQYRLSILGESEGAIVDHKYYSGDWLPHYAPAPELVTLAGAMQTVLDLRRQGEGERVV